MKRKTLMLFLSLGLMILTLSGIVFGHFVYYKGNDFSGNTITIKNTSIINPASLEATFNEPGDSFEFIFGINNEDDTNYNVDFSLSSSTTVLNEQLMQMIYVYQNDVYCGLLNDFVGIGSTSLPQSSYVFKNSIKNEAIKIKLELHNGAYEFTENTLVLNVNADVKTLNTQTYSVVSTYEELRQAINATKQLNKTIILNGDITVSNDLSISNNATIDLNGYSLILNANINLNENLTDFIVSIIDSEKLYQISGTGTFIINASQAFLKCDYDISSFINVLSYNENTLIDTLNTYLTKEDYVISQNNIDILKSYKAYLGVNGFSFTTSNGSVTNGILDVSTVTSFQVVELSFQTTANSYKKAIKVYPNSDATTILNTILNTDLKHLYYYSSNQVQVTNDLFLPTALKQYNAVISWYSSNSDILTSDGKTSQTGQGSVSLRATIKINNQVLTYDFNLTVMKQDDKMRLQYLISKISPIVIEGLYESNGKTLPTANDYTNYTSGESLGIEDIQYQLNSAYYYLTFNTANNLLYLNQVTFQKYAVIQIQATFDSGNVEEGSINIEIRLSHSSELQTLVYDYVQNYLNSVDVLANILQTRDQVGILNENGDFLMVDSYMGIKLSYAISTATYGDIITLVEEDGLTKVCVDLTKLKLTTRRVPITVNIVIDNEIAVSKDLHFNVPGALTKDNLSITTTNQLNMLYNVKLQAMQQLATSATYDGSKSLSDITLTEVLNLKPYLLTYDAENTRLLRFERGENDDLVDYYDLSTFIHLISWAQQTTVSDIPSDVIKSIPQKFRWIQSDGAETLSDGEITVILEYSGRYSFFQNQFLKYINVGDNKLSSSDILSLTNLLVDANFSKLITWATSTTTNIVSDIIDTDLGSLVDYPNDSKATINNLEEEVINYYVYSQLNAYYDSFVETWQQVITRLDQTASKQTFVDPIFPMIISWMNTTNDVNLKDQIDAAFGAGTTDLLFADSGITSFASEYTKNFLGTKYNSTSQNEWNVLKYYGYTIMGVTDVGIFVNEDGTDRYTAGTATSGVSESSSSLGKTYVRLTSAYQTTLTNAINADSFYTNIATVLSWSQSTTNIATAYSSVLQIQLGTAIEDGFTITLDEKTSDGKITVSYMEYLVIANFINLQLPSKVNSSLKSTIADVYLTDLSLDLTFADNVISSQDNMSLLNSISGGVLEDFNTIMAAITADKDHNPETCTSGDCPTYIDGLKTISQDEYNYVINHFSNVSGFAEAFAQFVVLPDNDDRSLDTDEINNLQTYIKDILGYTDGSYFNFIVLNTFDTDDTRLFNDMIKYFINLNDLSLVGSENQKLIENSEYANEIFETVSDSIVNSIQQLSLNYIALTDVESIRNFINLEYLDLHGNTDLDNIYGLTILDNGKLRYLNISNTGINSLYLQPLLTRLYVNYTSINTTSQPIYIYSVEGIEYLFIMDSSITSDDVAAMNYLYMLKEITSISYKYMQLPTKIYTLEGGNVVSVDVEWDAISGYIRIENLANNLVRATRTNTGASHAVLSATVNYNTGSFTRYFEIDLTEITNV